jgi:hypothetical protein
MLEITIKENELYDEQKNEFITIPALTLRMEHSLISLSKWESKWCKSFISRKDLTIEETLDYFRCMVITPQPVDSRVFAALTNDQITQIKEYIAAPMTATKFKDDGSKGRGSSESITSELIYYWMVTLQIPFECQRWHLNRLLTLIRVCNVKNAPSKKMSKNAIMRQNSALNAARRQSMHSRG